MKKTFETMEEVSEFLVNERLLVHTLVVNTIIDSIISGDHDRVVMEFSVTNNDSTIRINMAPKYWNDALNLSLEYFSSINHFERCIQIRELLKEINENI